MDGFIGGTRNYAPRPKELFPSRYQKIEETPLSELDISLLEAIPFWPETVLKVDLQNRFGIKHSTLNHRIDSIQFIGRVFDDFETRSLSRLKEDLSNVG